MSNSFFAFRQFLIHQEKCAMKVGTDGVLLGAWADIKGAERILDVGTGTGLIALMSAQRSGAFIDAVEIDGKASQQAIENCSASPWKGRIKVHCCSVQKFAIGAVCTYNRIISNPPFFRNSLKPALEHRSCARHDDRLSYEELIYYSSILLTESGILAVIIPASEMDHFTNLAYFRNLYPVRICLVKPHENKSHSRALCEFSSIPDSKCVKNEIILKKSGTNEMTREYKKLVSDFYLNVNE